MMRQKHKNRFIDCSKSAMPAFLIFFPLGHNNLIPFFPTSMTMEMSRPFPNLWPSTSCHCYCLTMKNLKIVTTEKIRRNGIKSN